MFCTQNDAAVLMNPLPPRVAKYMNGGHNEGMNWNKANILARRVGRAAFLFVIVCIAFPALSAVADAKSEWEMKAEQENASAVSQHRAGDDYYYGRGGVTRDYEKAMFWYRKAADRGDASSQFQLGYMYYRGDGVVQDYEEAAFWYRKAAEQGYDLAQYILGRMYEDGEGVTQNDEKAAHWYQKAAE